MTLRFLTPSDCLAEVQGKIRREGGKPRGSFPAPCHRGGVEPRRISLRKKFHMDSDANDR